MGFHAHAAAINYYTHGTQVTAAHAHLAFFGAYVMVNLAIITYAMPSLRGLQPYNQILNMWSFWIMTSAMAFMTFTLTFAGVIQTHMQRVLGGYSYMDVQDQLGLFYWMRLGSGAVFVVGAMLFVYAVFGPVREQLTAHDVRTSSGLRRRNKAWSILTSLRAATSAPPFTCHRDASANCSQWPSGSGCRYCSKGRPAAARPALSPTWRPGLGAAVHRLLPRRPHRSRSYRPLFA